MAMAMVMVMVAIPESSTIYRDFHDADRALCFFTHTSADNAVWTVALLNAEPAIPRRSNTDFQGAIFPGTFVLLVMDVSSIGSNSSPLPAKDTL